MIFALGFIAGLITSALIVATLAYFKKPIIQMLSVAEKQIELVGPRPKGFIVEPPSEADEARANIIAKNKARGADTPIDQLR